MEPYARRIMPDGREAIAYAITYGRARLAIGEPGAMVFDDVW